MKRRIFKGIGTLLFIIGFIGMFGEAQATVAQLLWSLGAAALCLIGGSIVDSNMREEDEV